MTLLLGAGCVTERNVSEDKLVWCGENLDRVSQAAGALDLETYPGPRPADAQELSAWEEVMEAWLGTPEGTRVCDAAWDRRYETPTAGPSSATTSHRPMHVGIVGIRLVG